MMSVLLEARDLSKQFGQTQALTKLSFEIRAGEITGLLGPNGAGKTTALRLLVGLLRPTSGSAQVLGFDCTSNANDVKRRIGYSPDEPAFYNFLTGREILEFVMRMRGLDAQESWIHLDRLVGLLDFDEALDALTSSYSHGMKKKLALLLALAHNPRVLLLDEPTNGLDPPSAQKVRELLTERARAGGSILVSTHLLDLADRLCSRVLILHRGRLIAEGAPSDLRQRAALPADASLEDSFLKLVG
jgi:ABC-2 type transport system ATP-binding protein